MGTDIPTATGIDTPHIRTIIIRTITTDIGRGGSSMSRPGITGTTFAGIIGIGANPGSNS
jgi:hypothetical protein